MLNTFVWTFEGITEAIAIIGCGFLIIAAIIYAIIRYLIDLWNKML